VLDRSADRRVREFRGLSSRGLSGPRSGHNLKDFCPLLSAGGSLIVKQMTESQQLLADYVKTGSETAFRDLVTCYVDLVHSAAVRLVNGDTHLAEDVTQTVFADLAKLARTLSRDVMLGGWLHRHTCYVASKTLRAERRRLARERQAVEMNSLEDHSAANLATVAPILDDAINQLGSEDRAAILLRFFEQHDFKSVGEALGSNEEAARKRVDRALDKLESLLKRRGVAFSAAALASALSAQAVSAAPAGLAITISSVALTSAAVGGGATLTILNIMSMTKLKVGIITVAIAAGVTIPVVMHHQSQTKLREANDALRRQADQNLLLEAQNARLASEAARAMTSSPVASSPSREVLKLRSEVGRLSAAERAAAAARTNQESALSGITADPVMRKTIRDQQKMGLGMIYKEFGKRAGLSTEMGDKLVELLADDVMDNIDRITEVLRDGKSPAEMDRVFLAQEAALREKVKALLEPEAYTKYLDYTKNLASSITAEQFKSMGMTGEKEEKDAKARQLYQLLQVESEQMLASAGLPPDFQTVPSLNFRNFASETEAEKNLKLLGDIYERAAARADSILSPQEIVKFGEFREMALNNNRMALAVNRKLMAPAAAAK